MPTSSTISTLAPSIVPRVGAPFKHEFHISGTGSFFGSCRNLFTDVRRREDNLCVGYPIVLDEYDFNLAVDAFIVIDHIRNRVDQLDCLLGTHITCRRLCSENKSSGIEVHLRMVFNLIVQIHYMKNIQKLAFIFMETLYLYIEYGSRINLDTVIVSDILCQPQFVLVLDLCKLSKRFRIITYFSACSSQTDR